MVLLFLLLTVLQKVMLVPLPVPANPHGSAVSSADVAPAALEDAGVVCWCLNRKGDRYVELLRVEFAVAPKVAGPGPTLVHFRGALDSPLATAVGTQGRKSLAFLPREDVRQFTQLADPRLNWHLLLLCTYSSWVPGRPGA